MDSSSPDSNPHFPSSARPRSRLGILNRITNVILDLAGFQQVSAWHAGHLIGMDDGTRTGRLRGHLEGQKEGSQTGLDEGRAAGYGEGKSEGFAQGHAQGFEEGKVIVELRPGLAADSAAPRIKEVPLFKDWRFAITPKMEAEIRQDVRDYIPDQQPSEDQWKMILSSSPTTSVVAGAGSGKSTTMVLRLIVLYHFLKIDLSSLTVVTFTKESKLDFAKKVREVFERGQLTLCA